MREIKVLAITRLWDIYKIIMSDNKINARNNEINKIGALDPFANN